jgi:glutamine cyclotransferase
VKNAKNAKNPRILRILPHDPTLYTQGLQWSADGKRLYESGGLYKVSRFVVHDPAGTSQHPVPPAFFAEGITELPTGEVIQLTWREGKVLVWNPETFHHRILDAPRLAEPHHEAWGVAAGAGGSGKLYVSNGTSRIHVWYMEGSGGLKNAPEEAFDVGVSRLNDLAYDARNNRLFANVWGSSHILVIDLNEAMPKIVFALDAATLLPQDMANPDAVLNGLAVHPITGHLWATGKLWDRMYEIEVP